MPPLLPQPPPTSHMKIPNAAASRLAQTVFLVDDSDVVRQNLARMIRTVPGTQIAGEAALAYEAINGIRRLKPTVVVLDISMPGGSGIEVLEAIRDEPLRPTVIMLTNLSHDRYRERCLQLGADYFLDKFFEMDRLPALIAQIAEPMIAAA